jgi:hypothetical protein
MIRQLLGLITAWCGLGLAASLLVGCGGSGGASAPSATLQAAAPITKAQATVYAHSVNLRAGDVPGMASFGTAEREDPAPDRSALEFAHCFGGMSPARAIVRTSSPEFSIPGVPARQAQFEESRVWVWPSPGRAARNYAAYQSSRGRACFMRGLEASRTQLNKQHPEGFQHGPPAVSTVPITLPGVQQSFLRTKAVPLLRGGRLRIHIYHDVFTFILGPAEIELEATGFGHPVPSATEQRLLLLLLGRAKANKL